MKKIAFLLIAFAIGFNFVACSQQPAQEKETVQETVQKPAKKNRLYDNMVKQYEKNGIVFTDDQQVEVRKLADAQLAKKRKAFKAVEGELTQEVRKEISKVHNKELSQAIIKTVMTKEQKAEMWKAFKEKKEKEQNKSN